MVYTKFKQYDVLILILMEHAQRAASLFVITVLCICLNPYFNGTCSKSSVILNFDGMKNTVLILILMEHAQRDCNDDIALFRATRVLILILMEHAQRELFNPE